MNTNSFPSGRIPRPPPLDSRNVNERGLPRRERRVEHLRYGEGHDRVARGGGDDDLFVSGIEGDPGVSRRPAQWCRNAQWLHHAFAAFRDLPELEVVPAVRDQEPVRTVDLELVAGPHRTYDDRLRLHVAAGAAIEDEDLAAASVAAAAAVGRNEQQVVDRIHAHRGDVAAAL